MRKKQKHKKEEMYRAIKLWQESGLAQSEFCRKENLSNKVFNYWLMKWRKEKGYIAGLGRKPKGAFIPLEVSHNGQPGNTVPSRIDISFPNGVQLSCPVGIDIHQLKTLINI